MTTAEDVTQRHAQAINNRDLASYLETMNFPFTYQNYTGVALTVAKASDCGVDAPLPWDIILKTDPHWHHTVLTSWRKWRDRPLLSSSKWAFVGLTTRETRMVVTRPSGSRPANMDTGVYSFATISVCDSCDI